MVARVEPYDSSSSIILWDAEFDVINSSQEKDIAEMINAAHAQALELLRKVIEEER